MINTYKTTFYFALADANEVMTVVKDPKNKRSVGPDEVSVSLSKRSSHVVSNPIAHIINSSFLTDIYPEALKLGCVTAISKKIRKIIHLKPTTNTLTMRFS